VKDCADARCCFLTAAKKKKTLYMCPGLLGVEDCADARCSVLAAAAKKNTVYMCTGLLGVEDCADARCSVLAAAGHDDYDGGARPFSGLRRKNRSNAGTELKASYTSSLRPYTLVA